MVPHIELTERNIRDRQMKKLDGLNVKRQKQMGSHLTGGVFNLSSKTLDAAAESILLWGVNCALPLKKVKKIICGVKLALKDIPLSEAEEVRGDVCRLIKAASTPPPQQKYYNTGMGSPASITMLPKYTSSMIG